MSGRVVTCTIVATKRLNIRMCFIWGSARHLRLATLAGILFTRGEKRFLRKWRLFVTYKSHMIVPSQVLAQPPSNQPKDQLVALLMHVQISHHSKDVWRYAFLVREGNPETTSTILNLNHRLSFNILFMHCSTPTCLLKNHELLNPSSHSRPTTLNIISQLTISLSTR